MNPGVQWLRPERLAGMICRKLAILALSVGPLDAAANQALPDFETGVFRGPAGESARTILVLAENRNKIEFDLQQLDEDGLSGSGSGRRSLDYEFCLPRNEQLIARIRQIDPTLQIFDGSPGRIGCGRREVLCIGNTHQVGWEDVLARLAAEPAIHRITRAYFE